MSELELTEEEKEHILQRRQEEKQHAQHSRALERLARLENTLNEVLRINYAEAILCVCDGRREVRLHDTRGTSTSRMWRMPVCDPGESEHS